MTGALSTPMRRALTAIVPILIALLLAAGAVAACLRLEDPLAALPREWQRASAVARESPERWRGRVFLHVTLDTAGVGTLRFVVSLPDPVPDRALPLVVVLGGLGGGSDAIREMSEIGGDPGPNAIVGFDWPLPSKEPEVVEIAMHVFAYRRAVLSVPGQVDALIDWAARQPWADRDRVSLLGFSLGGFVVPAAQWIASERGASIRWTVLGYAGAPIGAVIAEHPGMRPPWLRHAAGAVAGLLLRPIDPSLHLPHLRGRFLVLGAHSDRLIAPRAAERMRELTPQPRTVVLIEGDHMGVGPDKLKLLEKVIISSREWLLEQGAIDPPA